MLQSCTKKRGDFVYSSHIPILFSVKNIEANKGKNS